MFEQRGHISCQKRIHVNPDPSVLPQEQQPDKIPIHPSFLVVQVEHRTTLQLRPSRELLDIRDLQLESVGEPPQPLLQHLIPTEITVRPQDEFRPLDVLSRKVRLEHPLLSLRERREVDPPICVVVDPPPILHKPIQIRL